MEWSNLNNGNCPSCNKPLKFRLRGSKNSIRSRGGLSLKDNEDYYFCFKDDFQITGSKMYLIQQKNKEQYNELTKDCKYLGK